LHGFGFVAPVGGGDGGAQRRLLLPDFGLEGVERYEGGGRGGGDLHGGLYEVKFKGAHSKTRRTARQPARVLGRASIV
jgi:hypothetical protein